MNTTNSDNQVSGRPQTLRDKLEALLLDPERLRRRVDYSRWPTSKIAKFFNARGRIHNDWNNSERVLDDYDEDSEEIENVRIASGIYHETLISSWDKPKEERDRLARSALEALEEAVANFNAAKDTLPKRKD